MKFDRGQKRFDCVQRHARLIVVALLGFLLQACISPSNFSDPGDTDGLGGTGIVADRDGIGGSGVIDDSDGIGGTGHRGDEDGIGGSGLWDAALGSSDVAIIGIMSGGDTLVVNGHGMFYSAATKITLNGAAVGRGALLPGQVAAVRAGLVDGLIVAKTIEADDAVLGPITSIAGDRHSMIVLGQHVRIGATTMVAAESTLKVGEVVRVSGLRRFDTSIDASLIQRTTTVERPFISGFATRGEQGRSYIGDVDVSAQARADVNPHLIVSGHMVDGNFEVDRVRTRVSLPFAEEVDYYSIQAYASADPVKREVRFVGYPIALHAAANIDSSLVREQRVILNLTSPSATTVTLDRIVPSPVSAADPVPMIPRYSPDLMRLEVPIAPRLPNGAAPVEPLINVPQTARDVDQLIPLAPRIRVDPAAAPRRSPRGPRIDVTPRPVAPRARPPRVLPPVVLPPVDARPVLPRPQTDIRSIGP